MLAAGLVLTNWSSMEGFGGPSTTVIWRAGEEGAGNHDCVRTPGLIDNLLESTQALLRRWRCRLEFALATEFAARCDSDAEQRGRSGPGVLVGTCGRIFPQRANCGLLSL